MLLTHVPRVWILLGDGLNADTTELLITVQKQKTAATANEEQMVLYPAAQCPHKLIHTHGPQTHRNANPMIVIKR